MSRITAILIVLAVVALLGFGLIQNIGTSQAQERGSETGIMSKLQEVIKNQQTMIQKLDEIKQELYIVKIRASKK